MATENWKETEQTRHEAFMRTKEQEEITKPSHYEQYDYEPVTCIMENKLSFWMGDVIKYVMRAGAKLSSTEQTDLRKAKRYIDMRINQLEGSQITWADSD